jgi:hypothetical protein
MFSPLRINARYGIYGKYVERLGGVCENESEVSSW